MCVCVCVYVCSVSPFQFCGLTLRKVILRNVYLFMAEFDGPGVSGPVWLPGF